MKADIRSTADTGEEKPKVDPFPDGPMRQRDPEPDRIPRQDTNPSPNGEPTTPGFPTAVPSPKGSA